MCEWKPISEAPKDGTFFLGRFENKVVVIVNWHDYLCNGEFAWRDQRGFAVELGTGINLKEFIMWPE